MEGRDDVGPMKRLLGFLFSGRRAELGRVPQRDSEMQAPHDRQQLHRIDFEMMLKGSVYRRRRGTVRQYGVTVNGSTRLVTSGDVVDDDTFHALIVAGAIRPPQAIPPKPGKVGLVDHSIAEGDEI